MENLEQKIEAVLFYENEPMEIKRLAKLLEKSENEIKAALKNLSESLQNRGVCLVMTEKEASLATAPEMQPLVEKIAKDEMSKEIGKAGLETLAIILYNGPISRREIDCVRGVNSTFILRNLCIRGLVERGEDPRDKRTFRYKSSLNLLAALGVKKVEDLPDFATFQQKLGELKEQSNEGEQI